MRVTTDRLRARLREQEGFTMLMALGIMLVTMLMLSALFLAINSDQGLSRADLDGKRAYAAAQAGAQAYLFDLNHNATNPDWWQNCANDTGTVTVPGDSSESYHFQPVVTCTQGGAVGTVLNPSTGQLRMEFTGTSATARRTIVASFRTLTPLSYMWYTNHETEDTVLAPTDANCARYYWQSPGPSATCDIDWVTGDSVRGPMYTQDQYLIGAGAHPTLGGSSSDSIASSAPEDHVCVVGSSATQSACPQNVLVGTEDARAAFVPLPTDNQNLEGDAQAHGQVLYGATTITLAGTTMTIINCPGTTTGNNVNGNGNGKSSCTTQSGVPLSAAPLIYVANDSGCSDTYDPTNASSYPGTSPAGACGDVYLNGGTYSMPLTIASEHNIVIRGNVTDTTQVNGMPSAGATLGLVADQYVRVGHDQANGASGCSQTPSPDVTIDAAILTLAHSFFVDNYQCGNGSYGTLTVNGAIAQEFRGIVGTGSGVGTSGGTGYLKNYNYDPRFSYLMPPYMFDLQDTAWAVVRETLCGQTCASQ